MVTIPDGIGGGCEMGLESGSHLGHSADRFCHGLSTLHSQRVPATDEQGSAFFQPTLNPQLSTSAIDRSKVAPLASRQ